MVRKNFVAALGALALVALVPSPAAADDIVPLVNTDPITIPDSGTATPYPSSITVTGTSQPITHVEVVLNNLNHSATSDLDIMLVGPTGVAVFLMSDVVGPANTATLRFKDGSPPVPTPVVTGTYAPTDTDPGGDSDIQPPPANPTTATATALSAFNGTNPIGTWSLFINDEAAGDTGTLPSWQLEITVPSDACINVPEDGFTDVTDANIHEPAIDCLVAYGVANGTSPTTFNPTGNVSRAQMATFVAQAIEATGTALNPAPPDAFTDDNGTTHELRINQLKAANVIAGNGESGSSYFPSGEMRRDHMASYMYNAYTAVTGAPLAAGPNAFNDDNGNAYETAINALAAKGVITGTGGGNFNPNGTVSRAQMGSFLSRFLQLLDTAGALP